MLIVSYKIRLYLLHLRRLPFGIAIDSTLFRDSR
nr:MAG TPA: hypothetical protein [Caudoviricetes sp.]